MKTSILTIALALVTAFVLSQPPAVAKSSKASATKTAAQKKQHKKHWYKP